MDDKEKSGTAEVKRKESFHLTEMEAKYIVPNKEVPKKLLGKLKVKASA